jgi:hypothetical protein
LEAARAATARDFLRRSAVIRSSHNARPPPFLVDELEADSPLQLQRLVFPGAADEGRHFD